MVLAGPFRRPRPGRAIPPRRGALPRRQACRASVSRSDASARAAVRGVGPGQHRPADRRGPEELHGLVDAPAAADQDRRLPRGHGDVPPARSGQDLPDPVRVGEGEHARPVAGPEATEQPPYSILNRGIEARGAARGPALRDGHLLLEPARQGHAHRLASARVSKTDLRRAAMLTSFSDGPRLDAVQHIIPLAREAGLPIMHLVDGLSPSPTPARPARSSGRGRWSSSTTC